jgi:hypothetical protein
VAGFVTFTAHMNAGRPPTLRTPGSEDAIFTAMERRPCIYSWDMAQQLGKSEPRVHEVLLDDQLHPYH